MNTCTVSGNVGSNIKFGTTTSGAEACSFYLCSDKKTGSRTISTWLKVNVYDGQVELCRAKLKTGVFLELTGELMNREGPNGNQLLEIRAKEIVFQPTPDRSTKVEAPEQLELPYLTEG